MCNENQQRQAYAESKSTALAVEWATELKSTGIITAIGYQEKEIAAVMEEESIGIDDALELLAYRHLWNEFDKLSWG